MSLRPLGRPSRGGFPSGSPACARYPPNASSFSRTPKNSLPDFDDFQRVEYFALSEAELHLVQARPGTVEQIHCLLQLGYFKAKQAFFRFTWSAVPPEDLAFILSRYFPGVALSQHPLREHEVYAQRWTIADYFGFRPWAAILQPALVEKTSLWALGSGLGGR